MRRQRRGAEWPGPAAASRAGGGRSPPSSRRLRQGPGSGAGRQGRQGALRGRAGGMESAGQQSTPRPRGKAAESQPRAAARREGPVGQLGAACSVMTRGARGSLPPVPRARSPGKPRGVRQEDFLPQGLEPAPAATQHPRGRAHCQGSLPII